MVDRTEEESERIQQAARCVQGMWRGVREIMATQGFAQVTTFNETPVLAIEASVEFRDEKLAKAVYDLSTGGPATPEAFSVRATLSDSAKVTLRIAGPELKLAK